MNEEQRLSYLRRMGYQAYYPRFVLPGAKASPRYQIPEQAVAEAPVPQASASQPVATQQPRSKARTDSIARPILDVPTKRTRKSAETRQKAAETEVVATAVKSDSADDQLRFNLQYYSIGPQLAVISETPHQLRGKENRDSVGLLTAVLRALLPGFAESDPGLRGEAFNWPLAEGLGDDDPRRAAALALQGFVNQRQTQDGFSNLLIFTTQLPQILTGNEDEELAGDKALDNIQCQVTLTHSLHSMLAYPMLKRDVWAHLQALRNRLQR